MPSDIQVEIRHSGIWQLTSAVLSCRGEVLVVDPGYFPRELAELTQLAQRQGAVGAVAFTHGHWDHVIGWTCFPGARVLASATLRDAIAGDTALAQQNLLDARTFDGRWYVERPQPLAWPPPARVQALQADDTVPLGDARLTALTLPGHSADGLGLWCPEQGLLLVGDYLSPCEIPFVEDLAAYRDTLRRLLALLPAAQTVLPGHGPPLSAQAARDIAAADLDYLDQLAHCATTGDVAAAHALPLPRAAEVPGMREHHRENCEKAGLPPALESQSIHYK